MCGILGLVNRTTDSTLYESCFDEALQRIAHRGPDFSGKKKLQAATFGHRRLSIIDTSEKANQPMSDASGRYTIVYNGEFLNYKQHKAQLEKKGIQFQTDSDTEVLLYLFIEKGAACVHLINGFFAFAVWDSVKSTLFLARDAFGIKPLLYYNNQSHFIFASELKSLLAFPIEKEIDKNSLFTYLQLNYIAAPYSIVKEVYKLKPGHYIEIDFTKANSEVLQQSYYQIPFDTQKNPIASAQSYADAQKKLQHIFDDVIGEWLLSDVPIGTFLSGGIDSSIVTALAAQRVTKLNTFSIGFKDNPFLDETRFAQLVAKKYNTEHTVFSLTQQDLYENVQDILDNLDEPFADSSAIAVYILSKLTRKHVKVALSGDGADEIFGGYNKHFAEFRARNVGMNKNLVRFMSPLLNVLPKSRNSKLANFNRQLKRFADGVKLSNRDRYWRWASILTEEEANYFIKEDMLFSPHRLSDQAYDFKKRRDTILKNITKNGSLNEVLLTDMQLVLPDDMLRKVDAMSMANSLEVRPPFLDKRIVEFAFSLPDSFKVSANLKKKILQESFKNQLPNELFNRRKQGFEVPLHAWFNNEMKSLIENKYLNDAIIQEQGIFNAEAVKALKKRLFSKNPADAAASVWAIIVFQHWYDKYILH
jgi:asparagine synthase (glutamine-hydrolysing)